MAKLNRWSRREETDFYRVLTSFGIELEPDTNLPNWERFRHLARLETKLDATLSEYYYSFLAMCKSVCKKPLTPEEEAAPVLTPAVSEERATKVLGRVELMNRVRQALRHPLIEERIKLCRKASDFPGWWSVGEHDLELMKATAK